MFSEIFQVVGFTSSVIVSSVVTKEVDFPLGTNPLVRSAAEWFARK